MGLHERRGGRGRKERGLGLAQGLSRLHSTGLR